MGNGISTLFWSDLWIGNIYLKVRFPRLFSVSIEKGSYVADMGIWVSGRMESGNGHCCGEEGCLLGKSKWWLNYF